VVACADNTPIVRSHTKKEDGRLWNIEYAHKTVGIPKVYDDYKEMLAKEKLDVIISCPENAIHGDVCEEIAKVGAVMVTEKPMSASLSDALQAVRACRKYGTELIVNWPVTWSPNARKAKELIEAGVIGEVWEVKWRNGASLGPSPTPPAIRPGRMTKRAASGGTTRRRAAARCWTTAATAPACLAGTSASRPSPRWR